MKSLIKVFLIILLFCWITYSVEAVKVTVKEDVPWANCTGTWEINASGDFESFECNIKPWFDTVTTTMWAIIKYITFLVSLAWVLFIVINGIMLSMWGIDSSVKEDAKKRITRTIWGLILLLMSSVVLYVVAPWVYE